MAGPDYIICLNCETPCYTFEWEDGKIIEALCEMCGADDLDDFITEDGLEALASPGTED